MGGSEESKDERSSGTDIAFQAAREVVAEWHKNPDSGDDPQVMKVLDFACRQYAVYEQGPVETRMSVVISLGVRLAPIDMHDVRNILSTDNIALDRLGWEKTALFLAIPDTHQTFRFVAAMFWQTLFEHTIYQADHEKAGTLPRMLHCLLDEFPNLGMIPGFERLMATIRSRGISASIIVQNFTQGQALFKEDWPGIVANCDTKLFLGGDDQATAEWISKRLGEETIVPDETSQTYGANGSYSRSRRPMKRALLDPAEVAKLDDDDCILMIRGLDPYRSRKIGR
jgi:type IV secretion system protein VirD4